MLEDKGIDNIDLEGLAKNSGSTFGFITHDKKPPSQKKFETKIFEDLYFSKSDYIFIESESKRVGHVSVPNEIYEAIIRDGYHILLDCSLENRVKRLCRDYINGKDNLDILKDCINKFRKRLGNERIDRYITLLEEGKYEDLVEQYLVEYYDPLYMHSVEKYIYNAQINFDDMDIALDKAMEFHKAAVEGAI
jgi:tRNA 2-selenouridine synthase